MKKLIGLSLIAALLFSATGCRDEGPAEEMGREIDEAAEELGDRLDEAGDGMSDAASEACDDVDGVDC